MPTGHLYLDVRISWYHNATGEWYGWQLCVKSKNMLWHNDFLNVKRSIVIDIWGLFYGFGPHLVPKQSPYRDPDMIEKSSNIMEIYNL